MCESINHLFYKFSQTEIFCRYYFFFTTFGTIVAKYLLTTTYARCFFYVFVEYHKC